MAHLIQALTIGGVLRCVNSGKTTHTIARAWRTTSDLTGDAALLSAESDDYWEMVDTPTGGGTGVVSGSVEFGTACIQTISLQFISDRDTYADTITITITINGNLHATITRTGIIGTPTIITTTIGGGSPVVTGPTPPANGLGSNQIDDITLDLTSLSVAERPCGNIFNIAVSQDNNTNGYVYTHMRVVDVT